MFMSLPQSRDTPIPINADKTEIEKAQQIAGGIVSKLTSFLGDFAGVGERVRELADPYRKAVKAEINPQKFIDTNKTGFLTKSVSTVKSFLQQNIGKLDKSLEAQQNEVRKYAQTVIEGAKSNAFLTSRLHAFDITPVFIGLVNSIIGQNQAVYNALAQISSDLAKINPVIGSMIATFMPGLIKHTEGLELQKKKELFESLIATAKETSKLTKDIFGLMKDKLRDIFDQFIDINKAILNFLTGFTILGPIIETIWPKIQPYVATTLHLVFEPLAKRFSKLFGGIFEKLFFKQKREEVEAVNKIANTVGRIASGIETLNAGLNMLPERLRNVIARTPAGKVLEKTQTIAHNVIGTNTILGSALTAGGVSALGSLAGGREGGINISIPESKLAALSSELPELPELPELQNVTTTSETKTEKIVEKTAVKEKKNLLPFKLPVIGGITTTLATGLSAIGGTIGKLPGVSYVVQQTKPYIERGLNLTAKGLETATSKEFIFKRALPAAALGGIAYYTLVANKKAEEQNKYLQYYSELDKQSPISGLFNKLHKPVESIINRIERFNRYLTEEKQFISETLKSFFGAETAEKLIKRASKTTELMKKGLSFIRDSLRTETNSFIRYIQYQVKLGEHAVKGILNIHRIVSDKEFRRAYYALTKKYISEIGKAFIKSKEELAETIRDVTKSIMLTTATVIDKKVIPFLQKYSASFAETVKKYNEKISKTVTEFADKVYDNIKILSTTLQEGISTIETRLDDFIDTVKLAAVSVKDSFIHLVKNIPNLPKIIRDKEFRAQFVKELIKVSKWHELTNRIAAATTSLLSITKTSLLKFSETLDTVHKFADRAIVGVSKTINKVLTFTETYLPFTSKLLQRTNERITYELRALTNGIKIRTQQLILLLTSREFWQKMFDISKTAILIGKTYAAYYGKIFATQFRQIGSTLLQRFLKGSQKAGEGVISKIISYTKQTVIPSLLRRFDKFVEGIYTTASKVIQFMKPILDKVSFLFQPLVKIYKFFRIPPEVKHIDAQTKILHDDVNKVVDKLEDTNQWLKKIYDALVKQTKIKEVRFEKAGAKQIEIRSTTSASKFASKTTTAVNKEQKQIVKSPAFVLREQINKELKLSAAAISTATTNKAREVKEKSKTSTAFKKVKSVSVTEQLKEKLQFNKFVTKVSEQTKILKDIKDNTGKFVTKLSNLKKVFGGGLKSLLKGLLKLGGIIAGAIGGIISAITNIGGMIKSAIFKLIQIFLSGRFGSKLIESISSVKDFVSNLFQKSSAESNESKLFGGIFEKIKSATSFLAEKFSSIIDKVKSVTNLFSKEHTVASAGGFLNKLKSAAGFIAEHSGEFLGKLKSVGGFIAKHSGGLLSKIGGFIGEKLAGKALGKVLLGAIPGIGTALSIAWTAYDILDTFGLTDKIKEFGSKAISWVGEKLSSVKNTVKSAFHKVLDWFGFGKEESKKEEHEHKKLVSEIHKTAAETVKTSPIAKAVSATTGGAIITSQTTNVSPILQTNKTEKAESTLSSNTTINTTNIGKTVKQEHLQQVQIPATTTTTTGTEQTKPETTSPAAEKKEESGGIFSKILSVGKHIGSWALHKGLDILTSEAVKKTAEILMYAVPSGFFIANALYGGLDKFGITKNISRHILEKARHIIPAATKFAAKIGHSVIEKVKNIGSSITRFFGFGASSLQKTTAEKVSTESKSLIGSIIDKVKHSSLISKIGSFVSDKFSEIKNYISRAKGESLISRVSSFISDKLVKAKDYISKVKNSSLVSKIGSFISDKFTKVKEYVSNTSAIPKTIKSIEDYVNKVKHSSLISKIGSFVSDKLVKAKDYISSTATILKNIKSTSMFGHILSGVSGLIDLLHDKKEQLKLIKPVRTLKLMPRLVQHFGITGALAHIGKRLLQSAETVVSKLNLGKTLPYITSLAAPILTFLGGSSSNEAQANAINTTQPPRIEHTISSEQIKQVQQTLLANKMQSIKAQLQAPEATSTTHTISSLSATKVVGTVNTASSTLTKDTTLLRSELKETNSILQREYELHKEQIKLLTDIKQLLQEIAGGKVSHNTIHNNIAHHQANTVTHYSNVMHHSQTAVNNKKTEESDNLKDSIVNFFRNIF